MTQHLQDAKNTTLGGERAVRLLRVLSKGHGEAPPGTVLPSLSSLQSHQPPQPVGMDQGQRQRPH